MIKFWRLDALFAAPPSFVWGLGPAMWRSYTIFDQVKKKKTILVHLSLNRILPPVPGFQSVESYLQTMYLASLFGNVQNKSLWIVRFALTLRSLLRVTTYDCENLNNGLKATVRSKTQTNKYRRLSISNLGKNGFVMLNRQHDLIYNYANNHGDLLMEELNWLVPMQAEFLFQVKHNWRTKF